MLDNSHVWNAELGCFVSEKHRRIAEIINDYDRDLYLAFVPPSNRAENEEFPFAVMHVPTDGRPAYVVFKVKENEVDERLLSRVFLNDQRRNNPLEALEALETAHAAMKLKADIEAKEEAYDLAKSIVTSPLNTYRHNGHKYT